MVGELSPVCLSVEWRLTGKEKVAIFHLQTLFFLTATKSSKTSVNLENLCIFHGNRACLSVTLFWVTKNTRPVREVEIPDILGSEHNWISLLFPGILGQYPHWYCFHNSSATTLLIALFSGSGVLQHVHPGSQIRNSVISWDPSLWKHATVRNYQYIYLSLCLKQMQ